MSSFALGLKVIKRLCVDQSPVAWRNAKLTPTLFKAHEQPVFDWVAGHVKQHHALPQIETLSQQFPDTAPIDTPEPASYYLGLLESQFYYDTVSKANIESQGLLKTDQNAADAAIAVLKSAIKRVTEQRYRLRILDMAHEGPALIMGAYHNVATLEHLAMFGWPYMDLQSGGIMPGDVISFVGRPAVGKTWMTLWTTLANWRQRHMNVLYASMEMMTLPIAQRIASMYTKQNIAQLKVGGFSSQTFQKFHAGLQAMSFEKAKLYIVDGNLAATVDDIFDLADMLECRLVVIDGAYLLRHPNGRLDRFSRAAENVELIKRYVTDHEMMAFCSWQFNREAAKKQKKGKSDDKGDLEDIGYTDAIAQISSIALAMYQEDTVETLKERKVSVLKGRNGEMGQFSIAWQFDVMSFHQTMPTLGPQTADNPLLHWI